MKTIISCLIFLFLVSNVLGIGLPLPPGDWDPEVPPDICGNEACEIVVFAEFDIYVDETDPEGEYYCPADCSTCEELGYIKPPDCVDYGYSEDGCTVAECEGMSMVLLTDCPISTCSGGGGGCSHEWCESSGYSSCSTAECATLGYSTATPTKGSQVTKSSSDGGKEGSSFWIWVPWIIIIIMGVIIFVLMNKKENKLKGYWKGNQCVPGTRRGNL